MKIEVVTIAIVIIICAAPLLAGCANLIKSTASYQYCDHVLYERTGTKATIRAECELPRGNDLLAP